LHTFRVALISHEFPPFLIGGIGSHCYDLAYSLSKKKVDTTVICGSLSNQVEVDKVNSHLQIVRLPFYDKSPKFLWFQAQNLRNFAKLLDNVDIVHGVHPISSAACSHLAKKLEKPFVTTIHEVIMDSLRSLVVSSLSEWSLGDVMLNGVGYPLNDFLIKTCLNNADHVVVCGSNSFNHLKESYAIMAKKKTSIIYNGINFDKLSQIKGEISDENCSVTFFGRLVARKGILHLIKAIDLLKANFPEITLEIFGKGPLESKINSLVEKMGLQQNVHVRGHPSYENLIAEIRKSRVVALPSLSEVGPYVAALETMACKKPLVVFDLPFNREFVKNMQNGLLVEAGNSEVLAEKIGLLLPNKNLRNSISQNAYDYIRTNHNWDTLVEQYIKIYDECLN
jgi:glycosyltransferase involved in cell wall biosynthesis